jgi:hypothetical protein
MAALFPPILFFLTLANAAQVIEKWNITSLNTHFMGPNSGLPGGGKWLAGTEFNITLDFTIHREFLPATSRTNGSDIVTISAVPGPVNIMCSLTIEPYWTPDVRWIDCGSEGFRFRILDGKNFIPTNFTLEIVRGGLM